jgi:hypothetical protein
VPCFFVDDSKIVSFPYVINPSESHWRHLYAREKGQKKNQINQLLFELRYEPNPAILDVRGKLALILVPLQLLFANNL